MAEIYDEATGYLLGFDTPHSVVRRVLKPYSEFYDDVDQPTDGPPLMFVKTEHQVETRDGEIYFYRRSIKILSPTQYQENSYSSDADGDRSTVCLMQGRPPLASRKPEDQKMKLVIDGAYKHFKGGCYWLIGIAKPVQTPPEHTRSYSVMHSETEEIFEVYGIGTNAVYVASADSPPLAIYQAIGTAFKPGIWGRPLEMFCDGRFTLLGEDEVQIPPCYYDPVIVPGQYSSHHCPVCGELVIAGIPHTYDDLDWGDRSEQ